MYLLHVRDAIFRIEEYAKVGKEEFLAKPHWQDAIIRLPHSRQSHHKGCPVRRARRHGQVAAVIQHGLAR